MLKTVPDRGDQSQITCDHLADQPETIGHLDWLTWESPSGGVVNKVGHINGSRPAIAAVSSQTVAF